MDVDSATSCKNIAGLRSFLEGLNEVAKLLGATRSPEQQANDADKETSETLAFI